jgi:hypothetical protein
MRSQYQQHGIDDASEKKSQLQPSRRKNLGPVNPRELRAP